MAKRDIIKELAEQPETGANLAAALRTIFPKPNIQFEKYRSPLSQFTPEEIANPYGTITPQRKILDPYSMLLPMGTVKGVQSAIELAEAGARTAKGESVLNKVLNWFKPKYKGKLWTDPGEGFVGSGGYGRYYRLSKQAPGTGIKVGHPYATAPLEGESEFLKIFSPDPEMGRKIFNNDKVLQEYMPKFHTTPRAGSKLLYSQAMEPVDWHSLSDLPIHKRRQMVINFFRHAKKLGEQMDRYNMTLYDMHTANFGITKSGKPVILDLGLAVKSPMTGEGGVSAGTEAVRNMAATVKHYLGEGIDIDAFDDVAALGKKLDSGKISKAELSSPDFWSKNGIPIDPMATVRTPTSSIIPDPGTPSSSLMTESQLKREIRATENMMKRNSIFRGIFAPKLSKLNAELARRFEQQTIGPRLGATEDITKWSAEKLENRIKALRRLTKDKDIGDLFKSRLATLEKELASKGGKIEKILAGKGDYSKIGDDELMERINTLRHMDAYHGTVGANKQLTAMENEAVKRGLIKEVKDITKEVAETDPFDAFMRGFRRSRATKHQRMSDEDLFKALEKAREDLRAAPANRPNMIMKLRNTILDLTDELGRREGRNIDRGRLIE